jgi:LuxR family transcriptional regulator, maltose regulon positive regulatory protein
MSTATLLDSEAAAGHAVSAPPRLRPGARPYALQPARAGVVRRLVERPRLIAPLMEGRPLAVLAAPAGYGKTTVLEQWRAYDPRPFAWVTLAAGQHDPSRLTTSIAMAPTAAGTMASTHGTPGDLWSGVTRPVVVVLDAARAAGVDVAREALASLADAVPRGSTLALASRRGPALPLGRLRAQDDVVELGASQLAMTRSEVAELLHLSGLDLGERQIDRLFELTLGWPALLRIAARALREQGAGPGAPVALGGDDGIVGDYVREEIMAALGAEERTFLRRTSVIERLSGPACDAALGAGDSAEALRSAARAGVPLIALDRSGREYRHPPLLAQALRAELLRHEPALEPEIHRRLSAWYEQDGDAELAIEHAVRASDAERVAGLLADRCLALVAAGRAALVDGWLRRLGDEAAAGHPELALAAAVTAFARGEQEPSEGWAVRAAEPASPDSGAVARTVEVRASLIRAWTARDGVDAMVRDGRRAQAAIPQLGPWRSLSRLVEGSGRWLAGDREAAALLDEGARGAIFDAPLIRSLCLAELALLTLEQGDLEDAAVLAGRARRAVERDPGREHPLASLTFAASALVQALRGRTDAAREDLGHASRRLEALPDAPPWYAAVVRVVLARVQLKLSDASEARRLLGEASQLGRRAEGAVALGAWIEEGWGLADEFAAGPVACPDVLTLAELRVLRLLPSHLTFREIAARLHVSANTVKTQAHAVYRKLDARSRSEAVAHAAAIGLVEG